MNDVFDSLDLSDEEKQIYKILLVSGQLSLGELRSITRFDHSAITSALELLEAEGLTRPVPGLHGRYTALLPVGKAKEKLLETLTNLKSMSEEINVKANGTINEMERNIDDALQSLNDKAEALKQNMETDFETNKQAIDQAKEMQVQIFEQKSEEFKNRIKEINADLDRNSENFVKDQKLKFEEFYEKTKEKILEKITQAKDEFNMEFSPIQMEVGKYDEVIDKTGNHFENVKVKQVEELKSQKNSLTDAVEKTKTLHKNQAMEITKLLGEIESKLNEKGKKLEDTIKGTLEKIKQENTSTIDAIKNESQSADELFERTNNDINEIGITYNELIESTKEKFNALTKEIIRDNTLMVEKTQESGLSFLNMEKNVIQGQLEQIREYFDKTISDKKNEMQSVIDEQLKIITNQLIKNLDEMTSSFKQKVNETVDLLEKDYTKNFEDVKNNITGTINKSIEEIREKGENHAQMIDKTGEEISNKVSDIQNSIIEKFQDKKTEMSNGFERLMQIIEDINSNLHQLKDSSNDELQEILQNLHIDVTNLSQGFQDQWKQIEEQYNQTLENAMKRIDESIQFTENEISTAIHDLLNYTNDLKNELETSVENINQTFTVKLKEIRESYQTALENVGNDVIQSQNEGMENFNTKVISLKEELNDIFKRNQALEEQFIEETTSQSIEMMNEMSNALHAFSSQVESLGIKSLNNIKSTMDEMKSTQMEKTKSLLDGFVSNFVQNTTMVTSQIEALANTLDGFSKIIDSTETPSIKTTTVVGKEPIVEYMADMLGRVKSKATILVPNIEMVPDEKIQQLPTRAQVTVISYIDEITHRDWIDKMHSCNANVTLRTLSHGGNLPDFIGCEREGEEILLGTIDEGSNDYVAVASSSEYFVKILGNIVISDYSRGKSKQLQK